MSDAAATTQQSSYCPKVGCVCWTEIPVQDMDRAEKFYGNIFGWKFNHPAFHKEGEPVFYRVYSKEDIPMFGGGLRLTTKENHVVASEVPRTTVANRICFAVNGIEESLKLIEQEGGKRADPCMAIGEKMGYTAAFQDTEGNINSIWAASE